MKRIFFAIIAAMAIFAGCQKEDNSPTVSFEAALPVNADDITTLTLKVANYSGTEAVKVPVTFQSDAVEGTDYEVSAKEFVIGGPSPVNVITVKTLKFNTSKKVTATLGVPAGFKAGQYMTNVISLSGKIGYISFDKKKAIMSDKATIGISVFDEQGKSKKLEKGDKIPVSVNTEKSTAVEEENFKFRDEKAVIIEAGKNSGSLILDIIGEPVEGKDIIVLDLDLGEKYSIGETSSVSITIAGSDFTKMGGKWVIDSLVTDKEYMVTSWYIEDADQEAQVGKFPEYNAGDSFTIDVENMTFTPDFKSGFKNYFLGETEIAPDEDVKIGGESGFLPTYSFQNINRYLSETQKSENNEAMVGMRLIKTEDGKELLDLYIIDYQPKDFLSLLYEYTCIDDSVRPTTGTGGKPGVRPLTLMSGAYLNLTFKRAE